MNYTLLHTEDYQTEQSASIVKNGNTYSVDLYDKKSNTFVRKNVRTKEEAQDLYNKIIDCFINGWYTFELRADILK